MRILSSAVILLMLSAVFSPLVESADINTELIDSIRLKDSQKVKEAISKGSSVNAYMNTFDQSGVTPLMVAASVPDGSVEIGEILIEEGADVNAKDILGWTPLIYGAYHGQTAFVTLLIEKGADPNAKSNAGWTPLMYAAFNGQVNIGKLLIERGAVVNIVSREGERAYSIAESRGMGDFVDLLKHINAK